MNLDEQIDHMVAACDIFPNNSALHILGSLRELERLRRVVRFYACEDNWRNYDIGVGNEEIPGSSECAQDSGGMARRELKAASEDTPHGQ